VVAGGRGGKELLIVFLTQVCTLLAAIAIQSVLGRMLGPEGRGSYAVALVFGSLLGVVFTLGTDRAAQYFVMAEQLTMSQGFWVASLGVAVGSVLAVGLGTELMNTSLPFFAKADRSVLRLSLLLVPVTSFMTVLQLQMAGQRQFFRLGILTLVSATSNLVLVMILVAHMGLGVQGAIWGMILSQVLVAGLMLRHLAVDFDLGPTALNWSHFRPILSYGARYYGARLGHVLDIHVGTVLVAHFAGAREIGLFAASSALVLKVLLISESVETTLLPRVALDPEGRSLLVSQCARLSALSTGACLAVIALLAVPVIPLLLGPGFQDAVPLIWILVPGVFLHSGSKVFMTYFRGINRPGICSTVIWSGLIANSLTVVILYPVMGLPAAAWALTIGFLCRSMILVVAFSLATGETPVKIWLPGRADVEVVRGFASALLNRLSSTRGQSGHG
jgi:O-antigen/teichoic acid export membrane protein